MGKLVRDRIPDIIRASGRTPRVMTLRADAYQTALHNKLREEVDELVAVDTTDAVIGEAANVVEVLIAIAGERGVSLDSILDAAQRKRAQKGGFGMRLWLDDVDPNPANRGPSPGATQ